MSAAAPLPLLSVRNLKVEFGGGFLPGLRKPRVRALNDVNLDLRPGESVAVIGDTGCGKTTLARALLGALGKNVSGSIRFDQQERLVNSRVQPEAAIQWVPTDPTEGWNKRHTLARFIGNPLQRLQPKLDKDEVARRSLQAALWVRLRAEQLDLRARDLTPTEHWRAALARALVVGPQLLICDEPPRLDGGLDGASQTAFNESWLELLREVQQDRQRSLLLLTTDLIAVEALCQRAVVLYAGRIVEQAPISSLLRNPRHPYTRSLLEGDTRSRLTPPSGDAHPGIYSGCVYRGECSMAESSVCSSRSPHLSRIASDHYAACHFVG